MHYSSVYYLLVFITNLIFVLDTIIVKYFVYVLWIKFFELIPLVQTLEVQITEIKLGGSKTSYLRIWCVDPIGSEALHKWADILVLIYGLRVIGQECGHVFPQDVSFFYQVSGGEFRSEGIQLFA